MNVWGLSSLSFSEKTTSGTLVSRQNGIFHPDCGEGRKGWDLTPVAGSIFGPLSQRDISKSEFKNSQISKSCFVFQVIQVILSGKFFIAEEVDLSFIS